MNDKIVCYKINDEVEVFFRGSGDPNEKHELVGVKVYDEKECMTHEIGLTNKYDYLVAHKYMPHAYHDPK